MMPSKSFERMAGFTKTLAKTDFVGRGYKTDCMGIKHKRLTTTSAGLDRH